MIPIPFEHLRRRKNGPDLMLFLFLGIGHNASGISSAAIMTESNDDSYVDEVEPSSFNQINSILQFVSTDDSNSKHNVDYSAIGNFDTNVKRA